MVRKVLVDMLPKKFHHHHHPLCNSHRFCVCVCVCEVCSSAEESSGRNNSYYAARLVINCMNTPVTCFVQNATLHGWLSVLGGVGGGAVKWLHKQISFRHSWAAARGKHGHYEVKASLISATED